MFTKVKRRFELPIGCDSWQLCPAMKWAACLTRFHLEVTTFFSLLYSFANQSRDVGTMSLCISSSFFSKTSWISSVLVLPALAPPTYLLPGTSVQRRLIEALDLFFPTFFFFACVTVLRKLLLHDLHQGLNHRANHIKFRSRALTASTRRPSWARRAQVLLGQRPITWSLSRWPRPREWDNESEDRKFLTGSGKKIWNYARFMDQSIHPSKRTDAVRTSADRSTEFVQVLLHTHMTSADNGGRSAALSKLVLTLVDASPDGCDVLKWWAELARVLFTFSLSLPIEPRLGSIIHLKVHWALN